MEDTPAMPLAELIKEAERQLLKELGRSYFTVIGHQYFWRKIQKFAAEVAHVDVMSEDLARQYLRHLGYDTGHLQSPMPEKLGRTLSSLRILLDIHLNGRLCADRTRYLATTSVRVDNEVPRLKRRSRVQERLKSLPEQFRVPVEQYIEHCRDWGHSECMLASIQSVVPQFCLFLIARELSCLPELEPVHISQYIQSLAKLSPRTTATYGTITRCFLRFLYLRQIMKSDLTACVPKCYIKSYGKIPTVWTQDEVTRLLAQVDRGSPRGRRDYAILLLAAQTGMRVSDIIRLKFSNIQWEQKRIDIVQTKTCVPLAIPMSEELGWALIDYIKNSRPKTGSDIVFLSMASPYEPFVTKDNLYHIIAKYRRRAGIHRYARQSGGLHTLRHSLASNLLTADTPLPTISNILGHADPRSTAYYIKVDIAHLRECAIDPDGGER